MNSTSAEHPPSSKTQSKRNSIRKRVFLVLSALLLLLLIGGNTKIPLRFFPESSVAAYLSGYNPGITTSGSVAKVITLDDGSFLVSRIMTQFLVGGLLREDIISGPSHYDLLNKSDLFRVRSDGAIQWQRSYVHSSAKNYKYEKKYATANIQITHADFPEILKNNSDNLDTVVYQCNPNVIQLAVYEKNRIPITSTVDGTTSGFLIEDNINKLALPAVELNIDDGSMTTITETSRICQTKRLTISGEKPRYACDGNVDFLYQPLGTGESTYSLPFVQTVYWHFPCWFKYANGVLDTEGKSIMPRPGDSTSLIF